MSSIDDTITAAMVGCRFEPVPSTRDRSVREMALGPHHISHRFPFAGAISGADLMARNLARTNAVLARFLRPVCCS